MSSPQKYAIRLVTSSLDTLYLVAEEKQVVLGTIHDKFQRM